MSEPRRVRFFSETRALKKSICHPRDVLGWQIVSSRAAPFSPNPAVIPVLSQVTRVHMTRSTFASLASPRPAAAA